MPPLGAPAKSTFLRRDLAPPLEQQGKCVLYVDLWADHSSVQAKLITACLANALKDNENLIAKLHCNVPFTSVGALGFCLNPKSADNGKAPFPTRSYRCVSPPPKTWC